MRKRDRWDYLNSLLIALVQTMFWFGIMVMVEVDIGWDGTVGFFTGSFLMWLAMSGRGAADEG